MTEFGGANGHEEVLSIFYRRHLGDAGLNGATLRESSVRQPDQPSEHLTPVALELFEVEADI